jgi:phenylpropionate dioxygenase-like ring-hydroxylating dioxygenase large terminal subunit
MFVRNCWYVAAWDHEISADALFERKILGASIVFFRDTQGDVVALDNRCCHRSAPLSLGKKEGDCIRCMYHGLKFDQTGRCVEVPGQSAIPSSLKVKAYPIVTSTRWVWIWMGEVSRADASLIPPTPALNHPDWRMKPGYILYKANHLLISDNLLDFSHLSFVHAGTVFGILRVIFTPRSNFATCGRVSAILPDPPFRRELYRVIARSPASIAGATHDI